MGKYTELALTLREQKLKENESMMASIKDQCLTDFAEQIGKQGFATFGDRYDKPEWWRYNYDPEVVIRWAEAEGFDVIIELFGPDPQASMS